MYPHIAIRNRFSHWRVDLADDLEDESLYQVGKTLALVLRLNVLDKPSNNLHILVVVVVG